MHMINQINNKTMKKFYLLFLALMGTMTIHAQNAHQPQAVEPGTKGALPEVQAVAPAREGELPILNLSDVGYDPFIINGYVDVRANLSWPMVSEVGCEYYTIQYRNHGDGEWTTYKEGDTPRQFADRTVGMPMYIYGQTDYRLALHGGQYNGYVSNIVTARPLSMYSRYRGWSEESTIEHCMVGYPIGDELSFFADTSKDGSITEYSNEDGYFTYQWYRRNPNNWDMEKIEGATTINYTPALEDAGYQLIIEVGGDKVHCDFMLRHPLNGVVCVPVQASMAYIGADGFVLNTDYVIPNPKTMITRTISWDEDAAPFDSTCISERKPGQYVFRLPQEEYNFGIYDFSKPGYFLTFYYEMMEMYREVQPMGDRYKAPLAVKAEYNGATVATTIDIISKNIDDEWTVVASKSMEDAVDGVLEFTDSVGMNILFQRPCYVKARATDTTADTFYPSALTMSAAQTVTPGYDDKWEPVQVTIEVKSQAEGVEHITAAAAAKQYYTLDGRRGQSRGLNIIRMNDGSMKKVIMK